MRYGAVERGIASLDQLLAIKAQECTCTHTMYNGSLTGPCVSAINLDTWQINYGRKLKHASPPIDDKYMLLEYLKADVLAKRTQSPPPNQVAGIGNPGPTGLKVFAHEQRYIYSGLIPEEIHFAEEGTPWQLMQQVGECASKTSGNVFASILRRANQIKPGTSAGEIISALSSEKLPLGTTLYLYLDSAGKFVMDKSGPAWKTNIAADGVADPGFCENKYAIVNMTVNVKGDCRFTDPPYSGVHVEQKGDPEPPLGVDRAKWTPSSGYGNLLGVLEFENAINRACKFDQPN